MASRAARVNARSPRAASTDSTPAARTTAPSGDAPAFGTAGLATPTPAPSSAGGSKAGVSLTPAANRLPRRAGRLLRWRLHRAAASQRGGILAGGASLARLVGSRLRDSSEVPRQQGLLWKQ